MYVCKYVHVCTIFGYVVVIFLLIDVFTLIMMFCVEVNFNGLRRLHVSSVIRDQTFFHKSLSNMMKILQTLLNQHLCRIVHVLRF